MSYSNDGAYVYVCMNNCMHMSMSVGGGRREEIFLSKRSRPIKIYMMYFARDLPNFLFP